MLGWGIERRTFLHFGSFGGRPSVFFSNWVPMSSSRSTERKDRASELAAKSEHMAKEHGERRRRKRTPEEGTRAPKKSRSESESIRSQAPSVVDQPPEFDDFTEIDDQPPVRSALPSKTEQTRKPPSALDLLAIELDVFVRETMAALRRMHAGERVALFSALCMLVGSFLPWVSTTHQANQLGFFAGAIFHVAISLIGIRLSFARHLTLAKKKRSSSREILEKRQALWLVLLGVLSTIAGAGLLFSWGSAKSPWFNVDFHFGLYWTLAWGTGLSYGGYACFRRFK